MKKGQNPEQGGETQRGIEKVFVEGFKSLAGPHTVEIRPLTLLAGANSSGKSSLMQPLLLLKQTLDATYDPGPLLLDGPHVRFTSVDQLLTTVGDVSGFKVGVGVCGWLHLASFRAYAESLFQSTDGPDGLSVASTTYQLDRGDRIVLVEDMEPSVVWKLLRDMGFPEETLEDLLFGPRHFREEGGSDQAHFGISRRRPFLEVSASPPKSSGFKGFDWAGPLMHHVLRLIHVPGLRGNPERTYRTTAVGNAFPGTFDTYVASIVAHWQREESEKRLRLGHVLERLGLTSIVQARKLDASQVELRVGRLPRSDSSHDPDLVNVADVGFGVSQVLPVLVALLQAEPGQLVYLEQPELHLHPRAQVALAAVLAEAARRGVRVVAETHSALLLLAIQALVAEDELDPSTVLLHWFQRDEEGLTRITTSELDESGAYGDWPEDFAEVELQAQKRYLDAVGKR